MLKIIILILVVIITLIYCIVRDGKREADKHPLNIETDEHSPENIIFEEALRRVKTRNESEL